LLLYQLNTQAKPALAVVMYREITARHKLILSGKTQAHFECVECGYINNADIVGALNILERGHRLLACGESALAT